MAGKRGDKQLITVFGDAPDENKESEEAETCEADAGAYRFGILPSEQIKFSYRTKPNDNIKVTRERQLYFRAVGDPLGVRVHTLRPNKKRPSMTVLVEVAGKRGDKQLITVFGDAPDENKEPEEAQTCEDDEWRLYFRAVGEPLGVRVHTLRPNKKKTVDDGLGRSGGTRTHGLQYPKLARYQLRYTSIVFYFVYIRLLWYSSPELALIPVRSHSRNSRTPAPSPRSLLCGLHFQKTTLSCFFSFTNFATPR